MDKNSTLWHALQDLCSQSLELDHSTQIDPLHQLKQEVFILQNQHPYEAIYDALKKYVLANNKQGYIGTSNSTEMNFIYPILPTKHTGFWAHESTSTPQTDTHLANVFKILQFLDHSQLNHPAQYISQQLLQKDLKLWQEYLYPLIAFEFAHWLISHYPNNIYTVETINTLLTTHPEHSVRGLLIELVKRKADVRYIPALVHNAMIERDTSMESVRFIGGHRDGNGEFVSIQKPACEALMYFVGLGHLDPDGIRELFDKERY